MTSTTIRNAAAAVFAASILLACGGAPSAETPTTDAPDAVPSAGTSTSEKAVEAAEIAKAIAADPSRAEAIFGEKGTSRAEYEALLYEIAADPILTEAYEKARGN